MTPQLIKGETSLNEYRKVDCKNNADGVTRAVLQRWEEDGFREKIEGGIEDEGNNEVRCGGGENAGLLCWCDQGYLSLFMFHTVERNRGVNCVWWWGVRERAREGDKLNTNELQHF